MTRRLVSLATALVTICATGICLAQPSRPEVRATIGPKGALVRLITVWDKGARLQLSKAKPESIYKGEVAGTLASGHGRVIVALEVDDASQPFRLYVIDGNELGEPTKIARPAKRHDLPFAVAIAPTPTGFAVFFQEVDAKNPSTARTYLLWLDEEGTPKGAAKEVPVPWSLAAAAWNGNGFHLALIYPGDRRGMRLSMVSTSEAGQPQQHPDWASSPGYITDVHLVASNGEVHAFYRGGAGGDRLLESDVTQIRSWGREPPKAKDHGALPAHKAIAVSAKGKPRAVEGARLK